MEDDAVIEREAASFSEGQGEEEPQPVSVFEQLQAKREESRQKQKEPLMLEIPGNGGLLFAQYKPIPFNQSEALAKRLESGQRVDSKTVAGSCDTLIAACIGIWVKDPDHELANEDGLLPIDPNAPTPVKFDSRLASLLNFEADEKTGARGVVRQAFVGNEYAIVRQNIQYSQWVQGIDKESDEEFLGE